MIKSIGSFFGSFFVAFTKRHAKARKADSDASSFGTTVSQSPDTAAALFDSRQHEMTLDAPRSQDNGVSAPIATEPTLTRSVRSSRRTQKNAQGRIQFLKELLSDGAMPSKAIEQAGQRHGYSKRLLRDTLKELGGYTRRPSVQHGGWLWHLPPMSIASHENNVSSSLDHKEKER